jgi:hypothetical protein
MVARDRGLELAALLASAQLQQSDFDEHQLLDIVEGGFEEAKKRFDPDDPSQPKTTPVRIIIDRVEIGQLVLDR